MENHFRPGTPFPYLAVGTSRIGPQERYGGTVVYYYKTRADRDNHLKAERAAALGVSSK